MTREEAIEIVRENMHLSYDKGNIFEALKTLVPELAEWSEDEKIRKEMIRYFTEMKKGGSAALPYDDCIAYLERQKGQKPTENSVYPHSLDEAIQLYYSTYGNGKGGFDHISLPKFQDIVEEFVKSYGQKPTGWSEEDKYILKNIRDFVKENTINPNRVNCAEECLNWLKTLPKRFNLQPKQEWSEKDKNKIERLAFLVSVAEEKEMISPSESIDLRNFIKSLCPRPEQEQQIKKGDKVSIHCRKDREEHIIAIYDGKVGKVTDVWNKRYPWGHIAVKLDNGCNNSFHEDELEVLDALPSDVVHIPSVWREEDIKKSPSMCSWASIGDDGEYAHGEKYYDADGHEISKEEYEGLVGPTRGLK